MVSKSIPASQPFNTRTLQTCTPRYLPRFWATSSWRNAIRSFRNVLALTFASNHCQILCKISWCAACVALSWRQSIYPYSHKHPLFTSSSWTNFPSRLLTPNTSSPYPESTKMLRICACTQNPSTSRANPSAKAASLLIRVIRDPKAEKTDSDEFVRYGCTASSSWSCNSSLLCAAWVAKTGRRSRKSFLFERTNW